ncbi:hypothetical protein DB459_07005 [Bradyrhizobium sp. WD16]|nr:hypothetical protein DB459_07005 [Bradyrhizobium sp. WD16]
MHSLRRGAQRVEPALHRRDCRNAPARPDRAGSPRLVGDGRFVLSRLLVGRATVGKGLRIVGLETDPLPADGRNVPRRGSTAGIAVAAHYNGCLLILDCRFRRTPSALPQAVGRAVFC